MARSKSHKKKGNGMVQLKHVIEKLQKRLSLSKWAVAGHQQQQQQQEEFDEVGGRGMVPDDVKEGHFAVLAVDDGRPKRFVVSLSYLNHPQFLKLLKQAEEEFGFNQEGTLVIPCRPSELERILGEHWKDGSNGNGGDGCKTMVESC